MEQWKTCVYNGEVFPNYEVSTEGRVRNIKTGKLLKNSLTDKEYLSVKLCKDNQTKFCRVHRLVACTWIPNPHDYTDVDHIDKNRQNNSVENLRWLSHKNNIPTNPKQRKIKCIETGQTFNSLRQASKTLGVSRCAICNYLDGKTKSCKGLHFEYVD